MQIIEAKNWIDLFIPQKYYTHKLWNKAPPLSPVILPCVNNT